MARASALVAELTTLEEFNMSASATAAVSQQYISNHFGRESAHKCHPRAFVYTVTGMILPAVLHITKTDNGGSRLDFDGAEFLLPYPYFVGPTRRLLLIELGSVSAIPKFPLWSGVQGGAVLARNSDKAVVQVKEGETITIFTPNGIVAEVKFSDIMTSDRSFRFVLPAVEAFNFRFQIVERMLREAEQMEEGDGKINKEGRALHELAAMVGMSRRFPELRVKIINFIYERDKTLRQSVYDHFARACTEVNDMAAWMKLRVMQDAHSKKGNVRGADETSRTMAPPARRGPPASAITKKNDRRERDREAYEAKMKANPKRNDDSNSGKGKKSKKK